MTTQLYVAHGITEGRAFSRQDRALLRDVELARAATPRSVRGWFRGGRSV